MAEFDKKADLLPSATGVPEDAIAASRDNLVVMVFAKTTSPYFQHAVGIAQGAAQYSAMTVGKDTLHTAVFSREPEQAARAIALLRFASGWHTLQIFAGGRLHTGEPYAVHAILECYQQARHCVDADAHCLRLLGNAFKVPPSQRSSSFSIQIALPGEKITERELPKEVRFITPCRLLPDREFIEREHPATWSDQVQALAVSRGTDWCPLFAIEKFQQFD